MKMIDLSEHAVHSELRLDQLAAMYRNRDIEREQLEIEELRLQIEQIKAEIDRLKADAANEYAQAIKRIQSTSQISKD